MKNVILKIIVLFNFFFLLSVFVVYKGGSLDSLFPSDRQILSMSHNGGVITASGQKRDTSVQNSTVRKSKGRQSNSIQHDTGLVYVNKQRTLDTANVQRNITDSLKLERELEREKILLMVSSKSGPMFNDSEVVKKLVGTLPKFRTVKTQKDTLKKDTLKKQYIK